MPYVSGFLPSRSAPLFHNGPWPAGLDLRISLAGLPSASIDVTKMGLCGGMSFLARDIHESGDAAAALHQLAGHPPAAGPAHPLAAARQLPRPGRHPLLDPRDPGARPRDMVLGQGPVCGDGRRRASGDALRRRRWAGPDRGRPGPERVAVGRLPEPRRAGLRVRPRRDPAHPPRLRLQLRGQRQRHDLPRHRLLRARPADPHQRHLDGRPVRLRARLLRAAVPAQGPQPRLHRRRARQLRRRRPERRSRPARP